MNESDLHWLAGLLEGEGSFTKASPSSPAQCRINIQMVDEDVIARVARLFSVKYHAIKPSLERYQVTYSTHISGKNAVNLMRVLRSLMGKRRQEQIDMAIESYYQTRTKRIFLEQDIVDIEKRLQAGETHTSIANHYGVDRSSVSHLKKRLNLER